MKEQDIALAVGIAVAGAAAVAALGWIFTNAPITPKTTTPTTTPYTPPYIPPESRSVQYTVQITTRGSTFVSNTNLGDLIALGITNPIIGQTYTHTDPQGTVETIIIISSP